MKSILLAGLFAAVANAAPEALFNGKDLTGWEGNPELWSVKDGVITGQTTLEKPTAKNTFLIWKGDDVADFEITFKYKMTPGADKKFTNSGLQFRSKILDAATWAVTGYQADLEYGPKFSGILYDEKGRGILAQRGQKVKIVQSADPKKPTIEVLGEIGKSDEIQAAIKKDDWNEYRVVVQGNHIQQFINGVATVDVTDETAEAAKTGLLAFQLHQGPPMMIQFKDILLTKK